MSESNKPFLPNYPAIILLLFLIAPLVVVELVNGIEISNSFFESYKEYFGWIMLFEFILFLAVYTQIIVRFDEIPGRHKLPVIMSFAFISIAILLEFVSWVGYFNGGLYIFTWLSK